MRFDLNFPVQLCKAKLHLTSTIFHSLMPIFLWAENNAFLLLLNPLEIGTAGFEPQRLWCHLNIPVTTLKLKTSG